MSRTRRQAEALPSGSQVQTESSREPSPLPLTGTLRLRGAPLAETTQTTTETASTRRIRWSEDVVDNEGMGKKSSKVCCIYHKSHAVGESSSESESESESDDSSSSDSDTDARQRGIRRGRRKQDKDHHHHHECGSEEHDHDHDHGSGPHKHKSKRRKPSPNAYERVPNYTKKRPQ
ncbi:hypothetical protein DTO166G4_606 [Paecilomyces variotii]|uniref:Type 1 phosphatases regulator n=1 Tax=Byssochlamys spectabilis TaxID=264951 RepID=A0A443HL37_BYSSP|nr:phosphatase inhibitor-containing protein [Paecilomyces variotii]KAJ9217802.1 hypothetical protein DTO166G4_606 [Paecilomyces variotii]KAJ9228032.1 hypothetical protein DTO166G5_8924 [Paecilomyces variotii]KAJ9234560.1 hypothetical protein DTO169E5_6511 [Paecilomyces variotii]KAJ9249819.1 hypothetical protein DTO207G8_6439 [Paecilomyces variotii]KAJ9264094.1 hypothetical protein DTO195F2_2621 [Paecilomyces variotii]